MGGQELRSACALVGREAVTYNRDARPARSLDMKRRKVTPIAKRATARSIRSDEPERLKDFVEDPLPEKCDMKAEQKVAFRQPEDPDPRVVSNESDQGRTR